MKLYCVRCPQFPDVAHIAWSYWSTEVQALEMAGKFDSKEPCGPHTVVTLLDAAEDAQTKLDLIAARDLALNKLADAHRKLESLCYAHGNLLLLVHEVIKASRAAGEYIGRDGQLIGKLKRAVGEAPPITGEEGK